MIGIQRLIAVGIVLLTAAGIASADHPRSCITTCTDYRCQDTITICR